MDMGRFAFAWAAGNFVDVISRTGFFGGGPSGLVLRMGFPAFHNMRPAPISP